MAGVRSGLAAAGRYFTILLITIVGLEITSCLVLLVGIVPSSDASRLLLAKFPAQARLSGDVLHGVLSKASYQFGTDRHFYNFDFDPVLGYRQLSYLKWHTVAKESENFQIGSAAAWWNELGGAAKGKFLIVALGGSTTASSQTGNWPRHLPALLARARPDLETIVLNAGHNGFSTFQEKIFLSTWVLPFLEGQGLRPDLVLTLDGVNDVHFGIAGYLAFKQGGLPYWYSHYNGFHQVLERNIKTLDTVGGSLSNVVQVVGLSRWALGLASVAERVIPYTVEVFNGMRRPRWTTGPGAIRPVNQPLFVDRAHAVFRIRDGFVAFPEGISDISLAKPDKGLKVAGSLSDLLDLLGSYEKWQTAIAPGFNPATAFVEDRRNWGAVPTADIPQGVKFGVIGAMLDNLTDLHGAAEKRSIKAASFLQPIARAEYYGFASQARTKNIPDFDYALVNWTFHEAGTGTYARVPGDEMYGVARQGFELLEKRHPGGFRDLSLLFRDADHDLFTQDNIHYTAEGSEMIARAMVEHCVSAGLLGSP